MNATQILAIQMQIVPMLLVDMSVFATMDMKEMVLTVQVDNENNYCFD